LSCFTDLVKGLNASTLAVCQLGLYFLGFLEWVLAHRFISDAAMLSFEQKAVFLIDFSAK